MTAEANTKDEYLAAAFEFQAARPLVGHHTIGALTIEVGQRTWAVTDGAHFAAQGNARDPLALRGAVTRAVKKYVKLYCRK